MTNYIEEMMNTAGVTKHTIEICTKICPTKNLSYEERTEIKWETTYPDFTAEKQIEIIKLIAQHRIFKITPNATSTSTIDFTQALAQLTTELMNAGKLDKQKVKEILEG